MGTDVRKLVYNGYPAERVFAADLRQEFIDCGHELFQDADTCKIRFFATNIFDLQFPAAPVAPNNDLSIIARLEDLTGQITHCYLGALFHLFEEEKQYDLAKRVATFVKPSPGTIIFGRHEVSPDEPKILNDLGMPSMASVLLLRIVLLVALTDYVVDSGRFGHTTDTWKDLWTKVFTEIVSEDFAREHVITKATTTTNWGRGEIVDTRPDWILMFWSVEIV